MLDGDCGLIVGHSHSSSVSQQQTHHFFCEHTGGDEGRLPLLFIANLKWSVPLIAVITLLVVILIAE